MGYADCKETAITVSGEIPNSDVYYGLYVATTPRETWDQRWNRPGADPVFTHFWVVADNKVIDRAADQFGGPNEVITDITDPHYVMVGKYKKEDDTIVPIANDPVIEWGDGVVPGGTVVVKWNDFDKYMKQFK